MDRVRVIEYFRNVNKEKQAIVFDLSSNLEPVSLYKEIACRKSAKIMNIETTLCIHDLQKDKILSPSIWNKGLWEKEILELLIQAINQNLLKSTKK